LTDERIWPTRLNGLDISRGIAALAVVLWHWQHFGYQGYVPSEDFVKEFQPFYDCLQIFYEQGIRGVYYFFILSGFIFFWIYGREINAKRINTGTFFVHRFSRLYPLHIVTLVSVAILQHLYSIDNEIYFVYPYNDLYHFFLNVGFASNWGLEKGYSFNAPVWSVSIEVLIYSLFFYYAFLKRPGMLSSLMVSFLSIAIAQFFDHKLFIALSLFFTGGVVYFFTEAVSYRSLKLHCLLFLITILMWVSVFINIYILSITEILLNFGLLGEIFVKAFPYWILFPLTICSLALFDTNHPRAFSRLSWIGDITYSTYLLHFPLQLIFVIAIGLFEADSNIYQNKVYFLLYFAILIPASYFVFQKFERPAQRYLRAKL
jgi:peptidoglycan/LPS O-acetylase OafA/YrhL